MYISNRKFIISALLTVLGFFLVFEIINIVLGETTKAYFVGLPIGVLLGIAYCLLISEKWDPANLRPKEPGDSPAKNRWVWAVPLGVFVANILLNYFNSTIADLIVGVVGGWLYTSLGYVALQVWWYRPK
ncbi:MAG: hypothetical protein WAM60_12610 [Candidatus Promineifilaceae bacterium]